MNEAKILLLALLLLGCTPKTGAFPPDTSAIVDQALINRAACGRLPQFGQGAWTPPQQIIAPLEAALMTHLLPELKRDAEHFGTTPQMPSGYYRRYAGVTVLGQRLVVICGESRWLYDERGMDWRTTTIPYRDGGSGSFGAYYDPKTGTITHFEFGFVG